jgi:hypothetical protein
VTFNSDESEGGAGFAFEYACGAAKGTQTGNAEGDGASPPFQTLNSCFVQGLGLLLEIGSPHASTRVPQVGFRV